MKSKILPLVLSLILITTICSHAQWISKGSDLAFWPRDIWSIAVPNENTVWGTTFNNAEFLPTQEFTVSSNGGASWNPGTITMPTNQYGNHIFALDDQTAWVAATNQAWALPPEGGIYKTTNGGDTWVHQNTAYSTPNSSPHAVHFFDEDEGFTFGFPFNAEVKAYYTNTGGATWEPATIPAPELNEFVEYNTGNGMYAVSGETAWFVTTFARVFRTVDKGQNWEVVGQAFTPPLPGNSGPNSLAFKDELNGIAVSYNPPEAAVTSNGGVDWQPLPNFPGINVVQVEYIPGTEGTYIAHGGWGFDQSTTIVKTCDNGETWSVIDAKQNVNSLEFLSPTIGYGGNLVLTPTQGGIYKWEGDALICANATREIIPIPVVVSPNPASEFLNIDLPLTITGAANAVFYNLRGQLIHEFEFTNGSSIDISDLQTGMYFVKVAVGDRAYAGRFVVE